MAPDRPAEASPLDQAASRKGPASTTTTSIGLDVTPRRISTGVRAVQGSEYQVDQPPPPAELADHWWARWHIVVLDQ